MSAYNQQNLLLCRADYTADLWDGRSFECSHQTESQELHVNRMPLNLALRGNDFGNEMAEVIC